MGARGTRVSFYLNNMLMAVWKDTMRQKADVLNTVVGKGSVLEGDFNVTDGIRVDGILRGKLISSGALIVGVSGEVEADPIQVKDAIVAGRVRGTLHASRMVKLESSANVVGDITAQILVIEEGAVLHGICDTGGDQMAISDPVEKSVG